ncbi:potassium transporter 4-like isoform X2 [Nicotiana sylvestris]|uniref:potassium transporter 4-like isoform X2 n=1 Tax=Nicotiana sylvestris TaxID=4096 RepID=UPI0007B7F138|nr:PREDICTED: potassium transporter 4-like isoform X2 [Nicotiana tabacum]
MYEVGINHVEDSLEHPPSSAAAECQESIDTVRKEGQSGQTQQERRKRKLPSKFPLLNISRNLVLAYQSLGVVYGDLSTSPLYVYRSIFDGKLQDYQTPEAIFGSFSLIFWTITLIPLLKYVFIVLCADDNGEGGSFALYSLLCRHAKFSLLPNQQAADEELSAYRYGYSGQSTSCLQLKRFLEKHKKSRTVLLIIVLLGACMVIGDGVLTPAMSVISSMSGIKAAAEHLSHDGVLFLSCIILVGLFALQHSGTHRVGFLFAPIVIIWLISIMVIGLYNTVVWNPKVVAALSPYYIVKFFRETGKDGWISLGGVLLSVAGTEAMYADLGHFSAFSMRITFAFVVYPCLVIQYMGQAAFLSKNIDSLPNNFYSSIPDRVYWPVFVIATLAAIVGSQSIITATFSIVKQCNALGCFPRVKIVHTSKHKGQIYVPEINWILMILTLVVAIGFQDTTLIGNAYVIKAPQGGWVSLLFSLVLLAIMLVWHYGTRKKYKYDLHNKVPLKWLLGLGPSLGIVRVPGIGLIYSELVTGVPPIFSHFVTNLPAFHNVLVFVCVKSVPVPHVSSDERFLIGRVGPRPYRMYRCIVRYGYKDAQQDDGNFEDLLIQSLAEFIQMEAVEPQLSSSESPSLDGRMAVISMRILHSSSPLIISDEDFVTCSSIQSSKSQTLQSLRSSYEDENPEVRRRRVRFNLPENPGIDPEVRDELLDLVQAKEAGVAYIMGHSYVKARRSSSFWKKLAVDVGYTFLRKNCRGTAVALNIPHISLIEVGMIYHV